jgi:hypothetical protein
MEESRTLVLIATMRSPMARLPAIKLTYGLTCAKRTPTSAGDHPRFSRMRSGPAGAPLTDLRKHLPALLGVKWSQVQILSSRRSSEG